METSLTIDCDKEWLNCVSHAIGPVFLHWRGLPCINIMLLLAIDVHVLEFLDHYLFPRHYQRYVSPCSKRWQNCPEPKGLSCNRPVLQTLTSALRQTDRPNTLRMFRSRCPTIGWSCPPMRWPRKSRLARIARLSLTLGDRPIWAFPSRWRKLPILVGISRAERFCLGKLWLKVDRLAKWHMPTLDQNELLKQMEMRKV